MTTRRVLSIATILFLAIALVPLPALARGGPGGRSPRGRSPAAKHSAKNVGKQNGRRIETSPSVDPARAPKPKAAWKAKHRSTTTSGSVDASATPRLYGVENALSRIRRNLARMQAQIDAGQRDALPSGLVSVMEKFMSWLGISADPTSTPEPTATPEPTPTPLPSP